MSDPGVVIRLAGGRQLRLTWEGHGLTVHCPAGERVCLTRREAWELAEALDALATAADDGP